MLRKNSEGKKQSMVNDSKVKFTLEQATKAQ
jgi:hypothetical protein